MPDLALPRQLHAIGQRAIAEASATRASAVGAEHVLLAIAADPDAPAARALAAAGLDYPGLAAALHAERVRSLAVADVEAIDQSLLASAPRTTKPSWSASVRDLLRAADKTAAKTGARAGLPGALEIELTIGILRAELGTVPRALSLAGKDRASILQSLRGGVRP
jgi:ATP-dependent Clp protease ATP-binding subunit ClpA